MLQDPEAFEAARAELAYAYERVPFYREHLDSSGLHPTEISSVAMWGRVPATDKAHYRRHFPAGALARPFKPGQLGLLQTQSSGTTGERLTSVIGFDTSRRRLINCFSVNGNFTPSQMWEHKTRLCLYIPPNCAQVECANPNLDMQARMVSLAPGAKPRLTLPVLHDVMTTPDSMTARAAQELSDYKPHVLIADPNYLAFLARYVRRVNHSLPPLAGILSGYSRATAVARRQIADCFGRSTPFAETIGMTEFSLAVAMECPRQTLHLDTASYYAEVLVDGRPALPGELGELYLTSLGDKVEPHIRYRTGDMYRLEPTPCGCGSRFPSVQFEGRASNSIAVDGRIVMTPSALDRIVGPAAWIDVYQLVQIGPTDCSFSFVANHAYDADCAHTLRAKLSAALGPAYRLRFERVNYIACESSGKYQPLIALERDHQC